MNIKTVCYMMICPDPTRGHEKSQIVFQTSVLHLVSSECLLDILFQYHKGILIICIIVMLIVSTFLLLYTLGETRK